MDDIQDARKLLAQSRKEHLKVIRQMELDSCVKYFNDNIRKYAKPIEATAFDKLTVTARSAIDNNKGDFESHLDDLKGKNWDVLFRQDWFVIDRFNWLAQSPHMYSDAAEFNELVSVGKQALAANDMDKLRKATALLGYARIRVGGDDQILAGSNILVG